MLENWIAKHWFALFSGSILMGVALKIAYIENHDGQPSGSD